jgi:hypothetical protein
MAGPSVWLTLRHRDGAAGPGEDGLDVAGSVVELVVEVDGGVDESEVAERLGKVAELLPGDPVPLENRILALTWVFPVFRRLGRTR